MNVAARLERVDEGRIARQMREQPQLDLRVIGGHEQPTRARDEPAANVAAQLAPNRNVLQVRIAR